ncbi:HAD family hydrolase [Thermoleophilum album]|uniref:Putative hydrolase of the HAD superfamily n=1 Tax=Thermoleophilum album TaxID=29539 RepID=A0A1H6FP90_THEAL|nr:HAD family hydrolase [Thermoleophilum album]SEH11575.1 putative hydrolase of the HAD superfamily [Thermoleophilum album]
MALPKTVKFVSFDCYGTLIDWETGIYEAFRDEAAKDGFTIDRDQLIPLFMKTLREVMRGSYELYAEVLRRTAVRVARELGWELENVRSNFLPQSVPRWPPFAETNKVLERFRKKVDIGILSNIDDKLLGATRRHFTVDFDLVVTAQQVRSYKPDPAHFKECARRLEDRKKQWVHVASGWETDIEPCLKLKIPVVWVNRHGEEPPEKARKKPDVVVKNLREAAKALGV